MCRIVAPFFVIVLLSLVGCTSIPEGVSPIKDFNANKYLGVWYEIARLDHSFEKDLQQVRAEYRMREDGGIEVLNSGYNTTKGQWSQAKGKAYFASSPSTGHLKVSFFGPFYGSYVIFELADDYSYSFVTGNDRSYLWFLSRSPTVSDELKKKFLNDINLLGFDSSKVIFVNQQAESPQ